MTFESVCFLFEIPPVKSYYSRYDMGEFIERGYKVVVMDLSPIINVDFLEKASTDSLLTTEDNLEVYHIKSLGQFKQLIENNPNAYYWSTIPIFSKSYRILKIVSKYHYGFICNVDYVPGMFASKSEKKRKGYYTNWSIFRIKNALLARIPRKILPMKKADAVIMYTEEIKDALLNNTIWGNRTIIELTNTIDYLECQKKLKDVKERIVVEPYILFLDQYLPYHPETVEQKIHIDPNIYYDEINRFLKKVSEFLKMKVVIAAHPKADYLSHPECFPEYDVIQFRTAELVRDAEVIFSHYSLSLNFVFFFRKPYALISMDEIEKNDGLANNNEIISKLLNHKCYNISNNTLEIEKIINEAFEKNDSEANSNTDRCRLPDNHPNASLSFGEVMLKAMGESI